MDNIIENGLVPAGCVLVIKYEKERMFVRFNAGERVNRIDSGPDVVVGLIRLNGTTDVQMGDNRFVLRNMGGVAQINPVQA